MILTDWISLMRFRSVASATNDLSAPAHSVELTYSTHSARATGRRLHRSRQHLGNYRHDLLVAMRLVNRIEREIVQAEWENWLVDELARCDQVGRLLWEQSTQAGTANARREGDLEGLRRWHAEYCGSCRQEARRLEEHAGQGE